MYLFSMVLFTRVDAGVPWGWVDDLEELWYYAWGPAVHHFTTRNFKDVAQTVQEKEDLALPEKGIVMDE